MCQHGELTLRSDFPTSCHDMDSVSQRTIKAKCYYVVLEKSEYFGVIQIRLDFRVTVATTLCQIIAKCCLRFMVVIYRSDRNTDRRPILLDIFHVSCRSHSQF